MQFDRRAFLATLGTAATTRSRSRFVGRDQPRQVSSKPRLSRIGHSRQVPFVFS